MQTFAVDRAILAGAFEGEHVIATLNASSCAFAMGVLLQSRQILNA
jgi:hypothetical protein